MTRIEELKQTIEEIKGADELNKEDFLKFFDEKYNFQGCEVGYCIEMKNENVDFELYFTMLDIYKHFKEHETEKFEAMRKNYSEELIEAYENALKQADTNLMNNNSYYLNLSDEEKEINEIVLDYYFNNETEIDEEAIYQARDYIIEETIDQLNQLIEDEEN